MPQLPQSRPCLGSSLTPGAVASVGWLRRVGGLGSWFRAFSSFNSFGFALQYPGITQWLNHVKSITTSSSRDWNGRSTLPPARFAPRLGAIRTFFQFTRAEAVGGIPARAGPSGAAGFHAGMMWLIAQRTGDAWWRETAEHYSRLLEPRQHDRDVHDLGFIFLNTYLPWYRATGDERLRQVLITAGKTLALRFNPRGAYLRSFMAPESLFIDIMMNVPVIFYAARESGDQDLNRLAVAHCRTTEQTLVRADGSTAHEGIFDPDTGAFLRQATHQGYRADSTWARGLAWSLYGFGTVFTYTGDAADLSVAERNADCFIDRCPDGLVPPWDFDVPDGPRPHRRQLGRRHRRVGPLEPRRARRTARSGASQAVSRRVAHHSRFPLRRPVPGLVHARVGGRPQARCLSFPQKVGCG